MNKENNDYIFLQDTDEYETCIKVAKREWFEETLICQTRTRYGQLAEVNMDGEHGEDCCDTVLAYEYWDGSNHQSIELPGDYEIRYYEITDEDEVNKLTTLVEKARTDDEYSFEQRGTGYSGCTIDGYDIVQSQWQGDWELWTITEVEGEE